MKTKPITKLNTTDTYILVDKEGWLVNDKINKDILKYYPEIILGFTLDSIECMDGYIASDIIINRDEYEFFEIVQPNTLTPKIITDWNGTSPLEVGMLVAQGEVVLLGVNHTVGDVAVVDTKEEGISTYQLNKIKPIKTEKQIQREKVVDFVNKNRNTTTGKLADVLIEGGFKV